MDTIFDEDPFFTTLLQSGEQEISSTLMTSSHDNVGLQATQLAGEKRPPSKKTQRGVSFTVEEDNLLVLAWLNISVDAIRGTDQKYSQMWEKISDYYNEYKKPSMANRSGWSLTNRWSVIQKCTNKFCAAVTQVESLHPSVATEQDKHASILSTRRKLYGKCAAIADSTPLGDDTLDDNVEVISERPPGKKATKESVRKRKAGETYDAEFTEALNGMRNDRAIYISKRKQEISKSNSVAHDLLVEKKRKNDMLKRKIDMKLMKLDLAGMNRMQQEYFLNIRKEIFEESRKQFSSTSPPPSPSFDFEDV
ncbi:uncharacterized protein LOC122296873 [Carya illinoinensis]|uniref:No apical meristem-associated C-terminal domain-containing protein n=1 Tax=Carya illinoinensis TaxID=32201 RepID=A0A8T1NC38_CARIL|nr:uncharacterized protein LOC122296873 [Carya illinoinensis]KAG6627502.1 hypothetical protein CIPAW_15G133200 [Carya illinoinensis]